MTSTQTAEPSHHQPFSLMQGGPLHRAGRSLGVPSGNAGLIYLGLGLAVLTWLPLLAFAAAEGTLIGGRTVTFLASTAVHVRLLLGIPLFFAAEAAFDLRAGQVLRALVDSRLVAECDEPQFNRAIARASRWRDAGVIEFAAVAITILLAVNGLRNELPSTISTWRIDAVGQPSLAGWWNAAVSVPVYQFLMLRWVVHLTIWAWLLRQIARLDLRLTPTHPDLFGGLGILSVAHVALAPLNFALSAILAADYAEQLRYAGADIREVFLRIGLATAASTFALIAPLLLFMPGSSTSDSGGCSSTATWPRITRGPSTPSGCAAPTRRTSPCSARPTCSRSPTWVIRSASFNRCASCRSPGPRSSRWPAPPLCRRCHWSIT